MSKRTQSRATQYATALGKHQAIHKRLAKLNLQPTTLNPIIANAMATWSRHETKRDLLDTK